MSQGPRKMTHFICQKHLERATRVKNIAHKSPILAGLSGKRNTNLFEPHSRDHCNSAVFRKTLIPSTDTNAVFNKIIL